MMLPTNASYYKLFQEHKLAYASLMLLQQRCGVYFLENFNNTGSFPGNGCDLVWPFNEEIDVCLFGDAINVLTHIKEWPALPNYRLWVLCERMQELVHQCFSLPKNQLGIIPRYKIFPRIEKSNLLPNLLHDKISFVISSNFALAKNLDLTIGVVHSLQQLNPLVELHICSPRPENDILNSYINNYSWSRSPINHGNLGFDWNQLQVENPCLINLSTNLFEDFGVTNAQAQQMGWPLIVSAWGAHFDLEGKNLIKVPLETMGLHISTDALDKRVKNVTHYLYENWSSSVSYENSFKEKAPALINKQTLLKHSKFYQANWKHSETLEVYKRSHFDPNLNIAKKIVEVFREEI